MHYMTHANIITSFVAGLVMFLAPCTLPLVPGFIAFIGQREKSHVMRAAAFFCLGFLLTFLIFGLLAGILGHVLAPVKNIAQIVGGLFVIALGFSMLGGLTLPIFGFNLGKIYHGKFSAFVFGVSIALGWSPCVGPVLAGIFFYAAFSWSIMQALYLFFFFSFGFILPFMIIAYLIKRGRKMSLASSKWISVLAGVLLIGIGILLLVDRFGVVAGFLYKVFNFFHYEKINNLL